MISRERAIADRRASWSARPAYESFSPQAISVGAVTRPSSREKSGVSRNPLNSSRHTRAGTVRLSLTMTSRNSAGISRASVLTWKSLASPGAIGSASVDNSVSQNSWIMAWRWSVWKEPIRTRPATRLG